MPNYDKYFEAQCHICRAKTEVRWKNIYHMGSEGLDICWPCEKKVLNFIEEMKRGYHRKRVSEIKRGKCHEKR
jgi:hypothetical protein